MGNRSFPSPTNDNPSRIEFMYLDFFNLRQPPFHITPDPEFLYLSPSHKEALASIIYGIEERKGFIAITGEVGLGKTTIIRTYLEQYDPSNIKTVLVFNANVSFRGLLKIIYQELGIDPPALETFDLVQDLHRILIDEYQKGWNVVLIVDEAQNMPLETLENLRMLSNLESTKDKLIQIILVGQPELDHILELHQLRQLRQRIAIRATIQPLTEDESFDYIRHRLSRVRLDHEPIFTTGALKRIIKEAQGIPRKINILCDNALITAFGYGKRPVPLSVVREVVADLEGQKKGSRLVRLAAWSLVLLLLVAAVMWALPLVRNPGSLPWHLQEEIASIKKILGLSSDTILVPTPTEPQPAVKSPRRPKLIRPLPTPDTPSSSAAASSRQPKIERKTRTPPPDQSAPMMENGGKAKEDSTQPIAPQPMPEPAPRFSPYDQIR